MLRTLRRTFRRLRDSGRIRQQRGRRSRTDTAPPLSLHTFCRLIDIRIVAERREDDAADDTLQLPTIRDGHGLLYAGADDEADARWLEEARAVDVILQAKCFCLYDRRSICATARTLAD